jgi:hypothetical protein
VLSVVAPEQLGIVVGQTSGLAEILVRYPSLVVQKAVILGRIGHAAGRLRLQRGMTGHA